MSSTKISQLPVLVTMSNTTVLPVVDGVMKMVILLIIVLYQKHLLHLRLQPRKNYWLNYWPYRHRFSRYSKFNK